MDAVSLTLTLDSILLVYGVPRRFIMLSNDWERRNPYRAGRIIVAELLEYEILLGLHFCHRTPHVCEHGSRDCGIGPEHASD